jgi:hypothetical protein
MDVCTVDCYHGPAVHPNHSSSGSGPSNLSFWASSASGLFEFGPWSLESSIFGLATPSCYSIADFGPSNYLLRASSASTLFEGGCPILRITSFSHQHFVLFGCSSLSFEFLFGAFNALHSKYLNLGGNIPVQMPYVKPRFATPDGPVFVSSTLSRVTFHTFGMKSASMNASGASH